MNYNSCLLYLIVIGFLGISFVLPAFLYNHTDGALSYWQVLGMFFTFVAVVFGLWYYVEKKLKNPSLQEQDKEYLKKIEKKKSKNTSIEKKKPSFLFEKLFYGALFWAVLSSIVMACDYNLMIDQPDTVTSQTIWNADNIPLPHLYNGNLYVSNPDSVISEQTVDSMNVILKKLDKELGIESVVIIVNRIEDADAFRWRFGRDSGPQWRGCTVGCA